MVNRRDDIADAFKKHFHYYGFKKTSVDDVAGELHISKKTIYEYFDSKEEVFEFVISREAKNMGTRMDANLGEVQGSEAKIRVLIHMIFENAASYIAASQSLDFKSQDEIATRAFQSAYEGILRQVVDKGKQEKAFSGTFDDLDLSFVYAVIQKALMSMRDEPAKNPELAVFAMVIKMLK
jgi:AcrR family transcriptional regulator